MPIGDGSEQTQAIQERREPKRRTVFSRSRQHQTEVVESPRALAEKPGLEDSVCAGAISTMQVYAMIKARIVTLDNNMHLVAEEQMDEYAAACAEFYTLEPAAEQSTFWARRTSKASRRTRGERR